MTESEHLEQALVEIGNCRSTGSSHAVLRSRECAALQNELARLRAAATKLQAFKGYVHGRLDAAGVPADPDSPYRAAGCRIGRRLDALLRVWGAVPTGAEPKETQ